MKSGPNDRQPHSEAEMYEAFVNQLYWELSPDSHEPSDEDDSSER